MRKFTPAKITMAVAVSWGLFVGASIVSYAEDNENTSAQEDPGSTDDDSQENDSGLDNNTDNQSNDVQSNDNLVNDVAADDDIVNDIQGNDVLTLTAEDDGSKDENTASDIPGLIPVTYGQNETLSTGQLSMENNETLSADQLTGEAEEAPSTLLSTEENKNTDSTITEDAEESQLVPLDMSDVDDEQEATMHLTLAILSDTHYISNEQKEGEYGSKHIAETAQTEMRMLEEIDGIINTTLDMVADKEPDCLLVCGDLTSNGEYSGAQALANKLNAVKEKEGMADVGIYVVNGNHDINNSYAADMTTEEVGAAKRIRPEDFKEVYNGLGYGEDDHCEGGSRTVYTPEGDDPSIAQNHGGLSYATDIADGVTLVVMDTGIYSEEDYENSRFSEAQKTAGYVSEGLLNWVVQQTQQAKSKGNLVLGMCHHSVMPHYTTATPTMDTYMAEFVIGNHLEVSTALADAGMSAVLTGHSHANDIAKFVSSSGNVLYDIQTAALCAYPVAWRTVNIDITGSGADAVYSFSIDTTFMNKDFDNVDTSKWSVTTNGETKSFKEDFGGSMQDYSYVKTGPSAETIEPDVDYLLKESFYKIAKSPEGSEGFVKEELQIPQSESVASYAINKAVELAQNNQTITKDVSVMGSSLGIKADLVSDGSQDQIIKYNVSVEDKTKLTEETGVIAIDLTGITKGINTIFETIDSSLRSGDWLKSNYKTSPLQKEVNKLVSNVLVTALNQQLDPNDPSSTGFNIAADALQAFAKGNEGTVQTEKRAKYQELLKGETFDNILKDALWNGIYNASSSQSNYPLLNGLLSTSIAPEGESKLISITATSKDPTYLNLVKVFADQINSPSTAISVLNTVSSLGKIKIIPSSLTGKISGALAELQLSLTQDTNIPEDSKWQFHTITLYTGDQYNAVRSTLTVEDFKAGMLATPGRDNYEFTGWYTSPDGGTLVTADTDFTNIYKIYAHWNYVGGSSEDDDQNDTGEEAINYENNQSADNYFVDSESGATAADYFETESEIDQMLDDAITTLNELNENPGAAVGAINLLQSAGSSEEIKVARQISDTIVDGQGNEVKDTVFITDTRCIGINLGKLSFLKPSLLKRLNNLDADLELFFIQNGKLVSIIISKGTDISRYADNNGFLGLWYLKSIIESGNIVSL